MKYQATWNDRVIDVELNKESSTFTAGSTADEFEFTLDNGRYFLRIGTKLHKIDNVNYDGSDIEFSMDGKWFKVSVKDEQDLLLDRLGFKTAGSSAEGQVNSPMPGKILDLMVDEGDLVVKGQAVAILEAMKMENEIKAPVNGTIAKISVEIGQSVEKRTPILEIK